MLYPCVPLTRRRPSLCRAIPLTLPTIEALQENSTTGGEARVLIPTIVGVIPPPQPTHRTPVMALYAIDPSELPPTDWMEREVFTVPSSFRRNAYCCPPIES